MINSRLGCCFLLLGGLVFANGRGDEVLLWPNGAAALLIPGGGHGHALRPFDGPVDNTWKDRLWEWMTDQKLLRK